jgi:hypothetical protein
MSKVMYQTCRDCNWQGMWTGGSAANDPAIDHLKQHPSHTVTNTDSDSFAMCEKCEVTYGRPQPDCKECEKLNG